MYKMTHEEFRSIHNALIDLVNLQHHVPGSQLDRVIQIHERLNDAMKSIRQQEREQWESRSERYESMRIACGFKAIWSKYDVELTDVHQYGPVKRMKYLETTTEILGSTWTDLYSAADDLIRGSGDNHHIYVEDFELDPTGEDLLLVTGS